MREWFANLEARDQRIVIVGSAVAAVIFFWALVWLPLERGRDNLETSVGNWQQSLVDLRVLAATMSANGGPARVTAPADTSQSVVVVVDQTLSERSLNKSVKRRQPTPNGIRVEFENVAFDQLVVWLGHLSDVYGLSVQAGSMTPAGQTGSGRINASLTLERSP